MVFIISHFGVTLVNNHDHHTSTIGTDGNVVKALTLIVEPSGGRCNHWSVVKMILVITIRRATPISTFLKTVKSEVGFGANKSNFIVIACGAFFPLILPLGRHLFASEYTRNLLK
ncbi:hypothetical protein QL285_012240 [Trifolium repens]|nr:hypothetical protein QL285_012240 [Trifolium repens]